MSVAYPLHTEMEYSVPADDGPISAQVILDLIRRALNGLRWLVEYRPLVAGEVWSAMA